MRFYGDISKVDEEKRMVWGYASTEAVDGQGEVVSKGAVEAALEDYMQWANIREMHQLSAVGTTTEANVDDRGLYIAAHVIDDAAWAKIVGGVYKGFSIGGRALERDAANRKRITKMSLSEISLVDRPCNPEARFDVFKAEDAGDGATVTVKVEVDASAAVAAIEAARADLEKLVSADEPDAMKKLQDDAAAAMAEVLETLKRLEKAETARALPPVLESGVELRKGMGGVARLGGLLAELAYSIFDTEMESQMEGDNSPVPEKLRGAFRALVEAYKAMSD